jgi:hypothetical protein
MEFLSPIITLVLGLAMAFFGRRFAIFLVAAAGFLLGLALGGRWFDNQVVSIIVGIVLGGVLGWLATRFLKALITIAGFILLGLVGLQLAQIFGFQDNALMQAVFFIVGGLIGAGLVWFLFNWGLIIVSGLAGALIAVGGLAALLGQSPATLVWQIVGIVVAGLGIWFQWRDMRRRGV